MKNYFFIPLLFFLVEATMLSAGAYYIEPLSAAVNPIGVHLQWTTYKELNVKQFVIEKSKDGMNYFEIGEEKASGFSLVDNKYHFLDMDNEAGTFFYRLRELSEDGTLSYSFVATAEVQFNNPLRVLSLQMDEGMGNAKITFDSQKAGDISVYLTDISGRKVEEYTFAADAGINTLKKEMLSAKAGFYVLHLEFEGDHERFTLWKDPNVAAAQSVPVASTEDMKKK